MDNEDRSENEKIIKRLLELEEKASAAERALEQERLRREEIADQNRKLLNERSCLLNIVRAEKQTIQEFQQKYQKLEEQTSLLDDQIRVSEFIL